MELVRDFQLLEILLGSREPGQELVLHVRILQSCEDLRHGRASKPVFEGLDLLTILFQNWFVLFVLFFFILINDVESLGDLLCQGLHVSGWTVLAGLPD